MMARLKEVSSIPAGERLNTMLTQNERLQFYRDKGGMYANAQGDYSKASIEYAAYEAAQQRAPGGLGGILHHGTENEPGDEAAYPGHSNWPSFSHPPTPPPWGWRGFPPVWSWEIGWIFPAGYQYDWHMTPPPDYGMPDEPYAPSGNTLPDVPAMEPGDPMIIVLPRWQQGLGRYLTPNQEHYDHGVKPIRPVDSWHFGKLNYRLSAQRAMGRIT